MFPISLTISFPESSFPLTSGRKTRALGATISGMRHRCRLRSETGWTESPKFGYFKMVAPRALVFRPLVKGNEDSGNEIDLHDRDQGQNWKSYHCARAGQAILCWKYRTLDHLWFCCFDYFSASGIRSNDSKPVASLVPRAFLSAIGVGKSCGNEVAMGKNFFLANKCFETFKAVFQFSAWKRPQYYFLVACKNIKCVWFEITRNTYF